jgi:hypothetical protein
MLHDSQRVVATDAFFVCGGNPELNSGGGVIGTRNNFADALALKVEAIKQDYRAVQILTWKEMFEEGK